MMMSKQAKWPLLPSPIYNFIIIVIIIIVVVVVIVSSVFKMSFLLLSIYNMHNNQNNICN